MNAETIRSSIITALLELNPADWVSAEIEFCFPPFSNAGHKSIYLLRDKAGVVLPLFPKFEKGFPWRLLIYFYENCDKEKCNKILFKASRDKLQEGKIEFVFDEKILDEFLANLPKSKRGKTVPWYDDSSSITRLKEMVDSLKS